MYVRLFCKEMRLGGWLVVMIATAGCAIADTSSPKQHQKPKIKDLVKIVRIRPNFLLGYGVVVGLRDTGDKNAAKSKQILLESLARQGVSQEINLDSRNIALVAVTAELLPFACSGIRLATKVDSVGTATDISGGTLIATPLFGPDGKVYAVAQGPLPDSAKRVTSCRVLQGGMVENLMPSKMQDREIYLQLSAPNASLATSIARTINGKCGAKLAEAISPLCIKVQVPYSDTQQAMEFLSGVEELELGVCEVPKVIVDTQNQAIVVVGEDVPIDPLEITYNNTKIEIGDGVSEGIDADEVSLKSATLKHLIKVLQSINLSTRQIVEILLIMQERCVLRGVVIEID